MTENKKYGKREAAVKKASFGTYWRQHKAWVAGLSRGQRIKYRLFRLLGRPGLDQTARGP